MKTKTKVWLSILGIVLVAGAVLVTTYWKPISNFFVDGWNSIFNKQDTPTEEVAPTPEVTPEDNVELTIKYNI